MMGVVVLQQLQGHIEGDPAVEFANVQVKEGHTSHMMEAHMGTAGFLLPNVPALPVPSFLTV